MKKILLGAASVLTVAAPAVASADTSGHVAFSYNSLDDDTDSSKEDYLELNGSVATPLGGMWTLQFDGAVENMSHGGHTDGHSTGVVHAFTRNDSFAWGGFGGFSSGEADIYVLGAEGAMYLNRFTIAGSAFFGGDREYSDEEISGFGASGAWFVSDNTSISADVNYYDFDFGGGGANEQDGTIFGVNAEHQFANAFSIFAGYHWSDEDDFGTDKEVTSFTIGGRFHFGTGSLIERDRNGASMPGASQLNRAQVFAY